MTPLEIFEQGKGNRDPIFEDTLSYLNNKPANILEIGCLRDLSAASRRSDGWSSFHFAKYIEKYGGALTICDINNQSLDNCRTALQEINIVKLFNLIDGTEFLKGDGNKSYDLVFLDGSDDPNEMYEQYNLVKDRAELILCDDYHAKGSTMKNNNVPVILYKWDSADHELALTYDGVTSSIKKMIEIE